MSDHSTSTARPPGMSEPDAIALAILRESWGDRYRVNYVQNAERRWQAARIGSSGKYSVKSDTAEGLNKAIGADSRAWH